MIFKCYIGHANDAATVEFEISRNINTGEPVNGSCFVLYKDRKPDECNKMRISIRPSRLRDSCNIYNISKKTSLVSGGCESDFTVLCSKSNISINLLCYLSHNHETKKINGKMPYACMQAQIK